MSIESEYPDGSEIPRVRIGGTSWHACDIEGHGDLTEGLTVHMDGHSIETETETAENDSRNVSKCQTEAQTRDSPYMAEIEMSKRSRRWKGVSAEGVDVYLPWDAPIEALGRTFEFRQAESGVEVIAPIVEGETVEGAGNGDGDDGGDGDVDGTTSGDTVDST